MYIIKSIISVALFAIAAIAQSSIQFTSVPNNVQAGQSYTITWQGGDSTAVRKLSRIPGLAPAANVLNTACYHSAAQGLQHRSENRRNPHM
jgi:hypothetical protein